jgi:hypothetical protein
MQHLSASLDGRLEERSDSISIINDEGDVTFTKSHTRFLGDSSRNWVSAQYQSRSRRQNP